MTAHFTVTIHANPGRGEALVAMLNDFLESAVAFGGLLDLKVLQDAQDPDRILIIEEWVSRERCKEYATWRMGDERFPVMMTEIAKGPSPREHTARITHRSSAADSSVGG